MYIKTNDINRRHCNRCSNTIDVQTWFDTSNFESDRPLPKRKNKKVIGIIKDKLCEKILTKFVKLRAKNL